MIVKLVACQLIVAKLINVVLWHLANFQMSNKFWEKVSKVGQWFETNQKNHRLFHVFVTEFQ